MKKRKSTENSLEQSEYFFCFHQRNRHSRTGDAEQINCKRSNECERATTHRNLF